MPLRRDLARWSIALLRAGGPPQSPASASRLFERARRLAERIVGERGGEVSDVFCHTSAIAALVSAALERREHDQEDDGDVCTLVGALLERAFHPAAQVSFRSSGVVRVAERTIPRSVLYRGLLLVGLAGLERLRPRNRLSPTFDALAVSLATDLARNDRWLPTFGGTLAWPGDHAPAAAGLRLHGALCGEQRSAMTGERLLARLAGAPLPPLASGFLLLAGAPPQAESANHPGVPGGRFSGLGRLEPVLTRYPMTDALYLWARTARSWTVAPAEASS